MVRVDCDGIFRDDGTQERVICSGRSKQYLLNHTNITGIMAMSLGGVIAHVDSMITGNSEFKTRVERELRKDTL